MDAIKAQLLRIQQQLQGLNSSQRMLAGSLVAVMVMTMLWWGRYASTPEMVPLLNQSFAAEDISRISRILDGRAVPYTVNGDKIYIPSERKLQIIGDLSLDGSMPQDTHKGYEDMLKLDSQWNSDARSRSLRNDAKAAYLAQIMRTWPNVASANVVLDPTNERHVGEAGRQPMAVVDIKTRDGAKPNAKMAQAVVAMMTGAQSGLLDKNVKVVINSLPAKVGSETDGVLDSDETQERKFKIAAEYAERITSHLNIPGVLVAVDVDVETKTVKSSEVIYDKNGIAKAVTDETNESSESRNAVPAAMKDPGASANTGLSIDSVPSVPQENTIATEKTSTKSENRFGSRQTETFIPAGLARVVGASVRVPRRHFIDVWKDRKGGNSEPDDANLETLIKDELPDIKSAVRLSAGLPSDNVISVATYTDTTAALALATADTGATAGVGGLIGGHTKEIAMGALALMSLYMVSTIVKKSTPLPAIVRAPEIALPHRIGGDEELFGIAGASAGTLDAMELGDEEVRAQQVVEQVSGLVKENPDAAAALVKRWLNK